MVQKHFFQLVDFKIASQTVVTVFVFANPLVWNYYIHSAHSSIETLTMSHICLEALLVNYFVMVWCQNQNVEDDFARLIDKVFRHQAQKQLHHLVQSGAECNCR